MICSKPVGLARGYGDWGPVQGITSTLNSPLPHDFAWSLLRPSSFNFSSSSPSVHMLMCDSRAEMMKGWLCAIPGYFALVCEMKEKWEVKKNENNGANSMRS